MRYFEVLPNGKVITDGQKYCSSEITLLREIPFEELVQLDSTGKWCYGYAYDKYRVLCQSISWTTSTPTNFKCGYSPDPNLIFYSDPGDMNVDGSPIYDMLSEKSQQLGCFFYWSNYNFYPFFPEDMMDETISFLQSKVIEKDKTGIYCTLFARDIIGSDISLLQSKVIEKDKTGETCAFFAGNVKTANINLLRDALIQKDRDGKWIRLFESQLAERAERKEFYEKERS
jgi:hypothetical protein